MTETPSAADGGHSPLPGVGQFVLLPAVAFVLAAWATGFPADDPLYPFESRSLQSAAILTGLCSGLVVAVAFRSTAWLQGNRPIRHFVVVALAVLGMHFLWVEPIWGFHHLYSLGIFAWLFLGGEEEFEIVPSLPGLALTVVASIAHIVLLRAIVASLNRPPNQPPTFPSGEPGSGG